MDSREASRLLEEAGTPTMEEIFLLPGLQGRPVRFDSSSADGRWVFIRYNPLEVSAEGERSIADAGALRVLSTQAPESTNFVGQRIGELLPAALGQADAEAAKNPVEPQIALSHHGARVLVRRDGEVFLLDPPLEAHGRWEVRCVLQTSKDGPLQKLSSARFSENDDAILVNADKDLWWFPLKSAATTETWPLSVENGTNLTAAIEADADKLSFSRDRSVVFSRDVGLASVDVPATETTPSSQRAAQVLWRETGLPVELAGMSELKGVEDSELSPDGRYVFAASVDHSKEPAPTLIPDYLSTRVTTREGRRDLAEDLPLPRTLHLWDTRSGSAQVLDLGGSEVFWMGNSSWAPQPKPDSPAHLLLTRTSEDFRTRETFLWSEERSLVRIMVDRDERWIGGPVGGPRWSSDGQRLIFGSETISESSLPGRAQLFSYEVETGSLQQLTRVSGEVSSFDMAKNGEIVFSYSDDDAREQRKLALVERDGDVREIAAPVGFDEDPRIADEAQRIVFFHSRLFQPAELWSVDLQSGQPAVRLTQTAPPDFTRRDWILPQLFEVIGERDARVRSHVFLPRDSSLSHPDRPRACVVFIHGAGYLQNVTDSMTEYEPNLMFHSRLAGMGYVVVDVDYRGSSGYGQDFRSAVQYHLGGLELSDIHRTLDELAARGVIDPAHVGCYGGSYGGFLTLMALFTAGDRWSAGAALRSVTDWRTYHPGYTQPRLGRPSTHADAFALSSPIDHAEKLTKPLLLLHGMMDSNVFAQDTIRLMEKLIDQGSEFEVMLYPSQNHAFSDGAHWLDEYKRIEKFLLKNLGPP